ncbi:MAG: thiamine-phosphate pyrophosphorylase [Candidatus Omnitrophota bacterium]|nr:thiamine-phosphate pyrophosphorylase [Candidatus Omnitrophota bacterium]
MKSRVLRIIDANANRLTEGLRVCEDITRFILSDKIRTRCFKSLRHRVFSALKALTENKKVLAGFRDSREDIGRSTIKSERKRKNIADVFAANIKRAEESMRTLEEFSKLLKPCISERFKRMRFELYSMEKDIIEKLQVIRDP